VLGDKSVRGGVKTKPETCRPQRASSSVRGRKKGPEPSEPDFADDEEEIREGEAGRSKMAESVKAGLWVRGSEKEPHAASEYLREGAIRPIWTAGSSRKRGGEQKRYSDYQKKERGKDCLKRTGTELSFKTGGE